MKGCGRGYPFLLHRPAYFKEQHINLESQIHKSIKTFMFIFKNNFQLQNMFILGYLRDRNAAAHSVDCDIF